MGFAYIITLIKYSHVALSVNLLFVYDKMQDKKTSNYVYTYVLVFKNLAEKAII